MSQEKPRSYWVSEDRRHEMKQVTFGDRVQAFVASDSINGRPSLSVVYYTSTKNLPKILVRDFTENLCLCCGAGAMIAAIERSLDIVIFQHYLPKGDNLTQFVGSMEKRIIEGLEQYFSAYLNPN